MNISAKTLLNIRSDIYLYELILWLVLGIFYSHMFREFFLYGSLDYWECTSIYIDFVQSPRDWGFFSLPFFYVSPPQEYLSLRFKRNRLNIFGHLIAVYTCMLGENHQKNRTMARFRLNIKKKAKIHTTQWKARMCFDISKQFQPAFMSF